ncbi:uncharacterized protein MELLADRAFT_100975 [Melampsora larici-populina 98AG31]|uniref:Uncharacterized protein n=1 Tax=Melampsora larici-populina (strain 98AG31 / pathotype 3-4-7) TaxID=747676 RepID=F4R367_MELLP|nr:uncharacterized protein MELLADRAFT_100975 [Melampsora larici-populina 98AG31]EGG13223.1 hypothetical protein MELLADRAFT_100975 [Melampsora larici-populina 98AG31]
MPSNPLNRPLKKIKPTPKPVTDRQVQFLAQKKKDEKEIGRTFARITAAPAGTSLSIDHPHNWADQHYAGLDREDFDILQFPHGFDDLTSSPEDDDSDSEWSDIEDEEIISSIKRARNNARRLQAELRWAHQCHCMIPSFLRCLRSIEKRGKEVMKRLAEAEAELSSLLLANPTMTTEYLEVQWARQREVQKQVISESAKDKRDKLLVYMEFEEELIEARGKLEALESITPRIRTGEERNELLRLPNTIVLLERRAVDLAQELGALVLPNRTDERKRNMGFLHSSLMKSANRLWRSWDIGLGNALKWTATYLDAEYPDEELLTRWNEMKARVMTQCNEAFDMQPLIAEIEAI